MPDGADERPFGQNEALSLLKAGWTQGSVFRPNDEVCPPGATASGDVFLVVCTQACSLVLPSLQKEPHVELAVARPVAKFSAKAEAATGKDVRKFHLPVTGEAFPALEIDITSRFK